MPPPLLDPNDQGATLLPPPPPRHHGACLTPPPSAKGPVSPSRLAPPVDPINRRRSRSVGDEEHCFNNSRYSILAIKVRNMKMDFDTGGTWRRVGQ